TVVGVTIAPAQDGGPAASLYRVLPVEHAAPPAEGMFVVPPRNLGQVPDVLMPLAGRGTAGLAEPCRQGRAPLTYYVEFQAARDTPPGVYRYTLACESSAGRIDLRVTVRVREVTLPERLPFRSATTWNWSLKDYAGRDLTLDEKKVFWHFCLDYRLSPCAFFGREPDPSPDEAAGMRGRGLSLVSLMQVSGRKARPLSEKQKEQLAQSLKAWRASLEKAGMQHDAVALLADEPAPGQEAIHAANAAWLKEQFPELKIWMATRPTQTWAACVDVFDVCTAHSTPLYESHCHDEAALAWWRAERPYPRGEYWLFHSVEPYAPFANLRLDNAPMEGRVSGWQCAALGADGYEYFWIADWKGNSASKDVPWPERAAKWKTGLSGAGTLCYPDERMRPMPSLRLVNLRDGLEDWALLEQAAPRGDLNLRRALIRPVSRSLSEYTADPGVLLKARGKLFERLEKR
ncbi:MAG: DUF4091 domain-containing protein, partial [Planctomycetota bacterium]|nr:DUF4091 domain-containing protein [Planctomycetota bacterium]